MAEVKNNLIYCQGSPVVDPFLYQGDWVIRFDNTINDVLRWCMKQGNMNKEELKVHIDLLEE